MPRHSPAAQTVGTSVIPDLMRHAVSLVFQTMAHCDVLMLRHEHSPGPHTALHDVTRNHGSVVAGTIGFAGQANGSVFLYFSELLARQLAGDIIGLSAAEIESEGFDLVKDAIGELTNMVAGAFKNQLCTHGRVCQLTIPSILHGPPFTIETVAHTPCWAIEFETRGHRFVADVICDYVP